MALKLKGSTSGFVGLDAPAVSGNNTLILPENSGSAFQLFGNDITAGVTTFTTVTVSRNGDLTVPGTISIGGTLTYEDVTNVDSVGVVTARGLSIFGNTTGLNVASGISTFQGISLSGDTSGLSVSGIATFSTSLLVPDSIIHTGDTDTKIRFPSADTFTVETGGTERLRIDSTGRLLFNNADSYHGDADDFVLKERSGGNVGMTFQNTGTGYGVIYFADNSSTTVGRIQYDHTNDTLDLFAGGGERLHINSSGTKITGILTVTDYIELQNDNLYIQDSITHSGDTNTKFGFSNNDEFRVEVGGSQKLFVNTTGINVTGILTATAFAPTTGQLSHRNLIMNGQFMIWQRATDSGSNTTDGYLSADRWYHASSGATKQVTRQAFTPGQTDVPDNPKYYLRYAVTTGNNNVAIRQRIEDVTRVQGEMTFSFWVKGSNPGGGAFNLTFRQNFGSGGSASNVVDQGISDYTVTNSWTKKTFTFTPTSISGKTIGTTEGTSFYEIELFRQPAGDTSTAAFTVDFANVQLERGPVATPFEQRSYGEELESCRRYFQIIKGGSDDYTGISGYSETTSNARFPVYFRPPMRSDPTFSMSGTLRFQGGTNDSATFTSGLALQQVNDTFDGASLQLTGSSSMGAADRPGNLQFKANNSFISFDAEL